MVSPRVPARLLSPTLPIQLAAVSAADLSILKKTSVHLCPLVVNGQFTTKRDPSDYLNAVKLKVWLQLLRWSRGADGGRRFLNNKYRFVPAGVEKNTSVKEQERKTVGLSVRDAVQNSFWRADAGVSSQRFRPHRLGSSGKTPPSPTRKHSHPPDVLCCTILRPTYADSGNL